MMAHPYPAYRRSGVDWLGEIPAHWKIGRLKFSAIARTSNVDKHIQGGRGRGSTLQLR